MTNENELIRSNFSEPKFMFECCDFPQTIIFFLQIGTPINKLIWFCGALKQITIKYY